MDKPYFRELFTPPLESPIFVQGLPGIGNVGKIASHLLIKFCGAKPFAELYSPFFPDYVSVDFNGVCQLPKYQFYASSMEKNDFIIMTGDMQPSFEDVVAHYDLCGDILEFALKYKCSLAITMGGIPSSNNKGEVYVAATSPRLAKEFTKKGALLYRGGRVVGAAGLILGLARERGLDGACLLGSTMGLGADRGAGFSVFKFLTKFLGYEVKEGL